MSLCSLSLSLARSLSLSVSLSLSLYSLSLSLYIYEQKISTYTNNIDKPILCYKIHPKPQINSGPASCGAMGCPWIP